MRRSFGILLVLLFAVLAAQAQKTIKLKNPSFEDTPSAGKTPKGWVNCGVEGESAPDIQPQAMPGVKKSASDGKTYLGMVTRDNDTWEAVGQKLSKPLKAGYCYAFSIELSRSDFYLSRSRITGNVANYNIPVRFLIWAGNSPCEKIELLASTALIANTPWRAYEFALEPKGDYKFINFEAYFDAHYILPYGGNLLLDNASAITVGCSIDSSLQVESPLDTLPKYSVPHQDSLVSFIRDIGPKVDFQADEASLILHRYKGKDSNAIHIQNKYLEVIIQTLKKFPEAKLIIGVRGRFLDIEKNRKTNLERAITALGGNSKQFEVQLFDPKNKQADWLWKPYKRNLLMRLEFNAGK